MITIKILSIIPDYIDTSTSEKFNLITSGWSIKFDVLLHGLSVLNGQIRIPVLKSEQEIIDEIKFELKELVK